MQPDALLDAGETGCGELLMLIFQTMKTLGPGQTLRRKSTFQPGAARRATRSLSRQLIRGPNAF